MATTQAQSTTFLQHSARLCNILTLMWNSCPDTMGCRRFYYPNNQHIKESLNTHWCDRP